MTKEIYGTLAILLTFAAFIPYIRSILRGQTKPHVFSWVIWGVTTFVVFLAQLADGGGIGAWPIGLSSGINFAVAWLAYKRRADVSITKLDWFFFLVALSAVPVWYFTADPLWAVIILTVIDTFGFGPTLRKAYSAPYAEQLLFYGLTATFTLVSIGALENYSATTLLFPLVVSLSCILLVGIVFVRRLQLGPPPPVGWVLYDGACSFCTRLVTRWKRVLEGIGLTVAPLQEAWVAEKLHLSPEELLADMRVYLKNGELYTGPDAYRYVMRQIWWMWPLFGVSILPGARALFNAAYRGINRRRYCISANK